MKVLQSSFFRAICAIIVGALMVKYREDTVEAITVIIGVLFFLSGIISCAAYYGTRRKADSDIQVFDADGNQIAGSRPFFPIVGVGSLILGIILALMPTIFINWLMYIFAAILVLGAIGQYIALASVTKFCRVGFFFWIMPSLILLVGIFAIVKPTAIATAPLFVLGWCMMLYGVVECINTIKIMAVRRHFAAVNKTLEQQTPETDASDESENVEESNEDNV